MLRKKFLVFEVRLEKKYVVLKIGNIVKNIHLCCKNHYIKCHHHHLPLHLVVCRAATKFLHPCLSWAILVKESQEHCNSFISISTVLLQVSLGLPLFLFSVWCPMQCSSYNRVWFSTQYMPYPPPTSSEYDGTHIFLIASP